MAHYFESGFFAREAAWHKLGKVVAQDLPVEQAIVEAGLGWIVENLPCYDETGKELPNFCRRIVRMDTRQTLGSCGSGYVPIQNSELFEIIQALVNEGVKFETAGSLKSGKFVWALANMGVNQIKDDETRTYLLVYNWHNAAGSTKVMMTDVRVVCWNTLSVHLGREGENVLSIKHVGNVQEKLAEAKRIMEKAGTWREKFLDIANKLSDIKVNTRFMQNVAKKIFPEKLDKKMKDVNLEKREAILQIFIHQNEAAQVAVHNTAWGALNAVTDFVDHQLYGVKDGAKNELKKRESNMLSKLVNAGAQLKDAAFEIIVEEASLDLDVENPASFSLN